MSFAPFIDNAPLAADGVFTCQVDSGEFRAALATVRVVGGATVRCCLRADTLKLSSYARGSFGEEVIPAIGDGKAGAEGVAWLIDVSALAKLAGAFQSGLLRLQLHADKRLLVVTLGAAKVEFGTEPPRGLPDHRDRLGLPSLVGQVPVEILRQALKYAALLSGQAGESPVANLAVFDIDQAPSGTTGVAIGGSDRAMLALLSASLAGLQIDIPGGARNFVQKALSRLEPEQAELYRSDNFQMLLDGSHLFGWERPVTPFPHKLARGHLRARPLDLIQVSRSLLRQALTRVAAVSDPSGVVLLSASGSNQEAKLTVRGSDTLTGRLAEDSMEAARGQSEGSPMYGRVREVRVPIAALKALVSHFPEETVAIAMDGPTVRLFDRLPGGAAISVLSSQST